jgi:hypothetical protein
MSAAQLSAQRPEGASASRKKKLAIEHQHQSALFTWARAQRGRIPALLNLYAVPNAAPRTDIGRVWMHAEGLESGVWDVALDWPSGGYHGLRIEMKAPGEVLSIKQRDWGERYARAGYKTAICTDWWQARSAICQYLGVRE